MVYRRKLVSESNYSPALSYSDGGRGQVDQCDDCDDLHRSGVIECQMGQLIGRCSLHLLVSFGLEIQGLRKKLGSVATSPQDKICIVVARCDLFLEVVTPDFQPRGGGKASNLQPSIGRDCRPDEPHASQTSRKRIED
jgi:hypothetical protein